MSPIPVLLSYATVACLIFSSSAVVVEPPINLLGNVSPIIRPPWNVYEFFDLFLTLSFNDAQRTKGNCMISAGVLPNPNKTQSNPWYSGIWHPRTCPPMVLLGPSQFESQFEMEPRDHSNLTSLLIRIGNYKARGYVPTQLIVAQDGSGKLIYGTFMAFARKVELFDIWVPKNQDEADEQYESFTRSGFRLNTLTGFERDSSSAIMGVWAKSDLTSGKQKVHYSLPLAKCLLNDKLYGKAGFIPVLFQVYSVNGKPHCVGIWESCHRGYNYAIKSDTNLTRLAQSLLQESQLLPQQLSTYTDADGNAHYFMLTSEYTNQGYPALWENRAIPKSYLPGSTDGFSSEDLQRFDTVVHEHMRYYHVPAAVIAIVRDEQLKMAIAYGYTNHVTEEKVTWNTRMRIGSVSKTVTAVGIFTLIQEGRLSLEQKLWGPRTLFGTRYGHRPYSPDLLSMTVRDLLAHTEGGWSGRDNDGWPDPMFSNSSLSDDELISYVLDAWPLPYKPGVHWSYCNYGYFLLAKIIETISGMSYDEFIRERIVDRYAMKSFQLSPGFKFLTNEAAYLDNGLEDALEYDMARNAADGGWVGTPADLLRFSTRGDGFTRREDVINATTLAAMTEPSPPSNGTDAQGWTLNHGPYGSAPTWWHGWQHAGDTPGSHCMLARGDDGFQFAYIRSGGQSVHVDDFMVVFNAAKSVASWPDHDLFGDS